MGEKVISFEKNDIIVKYSSELGFEPYVFGEESIYFMLHQKYIPIQEYEISTVRNEYDSICIKDVELKADHITDENVDIVEYGIDFINCNIISDK